MTASTRKKTKEIAEEEAKNKETLGDDDKKGTTDKKDTDSSKNKPTESTELSEEDKVLKEELDLCVQRLSDPDVEIRFNSVKILVEQIRTSTSSLTSVPKPLKFLREHWEDLIKSFDTFSSKKPEHPAWFLHAEVLSVLGMTNGDEKERPCLKYRLLAETFIGEKPEVDAQKSLSTLNISEDVKSLLTDARTKASKGLGCWGHEYVKHLCHEIITIWPELSEDDAAIKKISVQSLVNEILPFLMAFNAETDACDLLLEIDQIEAIIDQIDENNIARVCLYLISCEPFVAEGDNTKLLETVLKIRRKHGHYTEALYVALQLNNMEEIEEVFINCPDALVRKQLAFILGRQHVFLQLNEMDSPAEAGIDTDEQEELVEIMSNSHLSQNFLTLARELDIMEPKSPEDVYKVHLENTRPGYGPSGSQVESARMSLANAYVNAFVNCGFGKDKLMDGDEGNKFIHRNKDHGMLAAAASIGAIQLWDVDAGLTAIDKYLYAPEENIKAGALLACGVVSSGIRNDFDPALALLSDYFTSDSDTLRRGAVFGIGLAYAGSNREDIITQLIESITKDKDKDSEKVGDAMETEESRTLKEVMSKASAEIISLVALSCGFITVGSCNSEIAGALLDIITDKASKSEIPVLAGDTWYRMLSLGLALPFLCQQDAVEPIAEALKKAIPDDSADVDFRDFTLVLLDAVAYAATGNVLKIQKFLHICSESAKVEKAEDKEDESKKSADPKSTGTSETKSSSTKANANSNEKESSSTKNKSSSTEGKGNFSRHAVAVLGIGLVAMNDDVGSEMAQRVLGSLLRYGETVIKKTVPLAFAVLCTSNPKLSVLDTLSKLTHDNVLEVAQNAIIAQGLVASGTNNARLAQQLRQLAQYYTKDSATLFLVRLTQGLVHMGKGTMTLQPYQGDRTLLNIVSLAGLTALLLACTDNQNLILGSKNGHFLLYSLMLSTHPKILQTFDEHLKPLQVTVRVGKAVDTVGQAGRPKTITGFTTRTTPVLLGFGERAELATDEFVSLTPVLEGFVILRKNPNFEKE